MGVNLVSSFILFNQNLETDVHVFFYCPFAVLLWEWIIKAIRSQVPKPLTPESRVHLECSIPCFWYLGKERNGMVAAFFITIFVHWKTRNGLVFRNCSLSDERPSWPSFFPSPVAKLISHFLVVLLSLLTVLGVHNCHSHTIFFVLVLLLLLFFSYIAALVAVFFFGGYSSQCIFLSSIRIFHLGKKM